MRSPTIVPFLLRCVLIALLVIVMFGGALSGQAGFGPTEGSAGTAPLIQLKKLLASPVRDHNRFGGSVAISGDTAVVGARRAGPGTGDTAYVYARDQGGVDNWGEVTKLTASDAQPADSFGNSLALSGDTAVVEIGRAHV